MLRSGRSGGPGEQLGTRKGSGNQKKGITGCKGFWRKGGSRAIAAERRAERKEVELERLGRITGEILHLAVSMDGEGTGS